MRLVEGRRQVRQFPRPPQARDASPEEPVEERSVDPGTPAVLSMEASKLPEEPVDRSAIPETFGEGLADPAAGSAAESAPSDG